MTFERQTFDSETVELDGNTFTDCQFQGCEIIYRGGEPPFIRDVNFNDCEFVPKDAALDTIQFLGLMYSTGLKKPIEETLEFIRNSGQTN